MNFPADLKYTTDHEWVRVEGNIATIGVTDHAQGELGDVVYIDVADSVSEVSQGESFGSIEAVKTVADLFAPISGKVIEVNRGLNDAPDTVNKDPYGEGWMVKIEMSNPSELDALMDVDSYTASVGH
ncbi:MAG: glycine cleavage system protein GcvH [Candidatus Kapabacteria bacterium]|nr:glycine cleavage system protein GcvH [Candidatus Kapabacteria bacterium]